MEANRVGSQPISICLLFLFVNLISSALVPEDEFKVSLYEAKDPIVQLSRDNFKEKIYDQPVAHLVEFYSSWCGHCVNFAPTWLEFSKQIAGEMIQLNRLNSSSKFNFSIAQTGMELSSRQRSTVGWMKICRLVVISLSTVSPHYWYSQDAYSCTKHVLDLSLNYFSISIIWLRVLSTQN